METILLQVFSQNWVIALLFVSSFFAFIYKWLPFMVKRFDEVLQTFKEMQNNQHAFFKEELEKISATFITQVESSKSWHESHNAKLEEIKQLIQK